MPNGAACWSLLVVTDKATVTLIICVWNTGQRTGNRSSVQFWPWICPDGERNRGDGSEHHGWAWEKMRRRFGLDHRQEPGLSRQTRDGQISPLLPRLFWCGRVRQAAGLIYHFTILLNHLFKKKPSATAFMARVGRSY
jgi:hypothetical protein